MIAAWGSPSISVTRKPPSSPPQTLCCARRSVRLVGETCRFDDLIADLIHELRWAVPTISPSLPAAMRSAPRTRFAPAIRVAHPGLGRDDVAELTRTETFALTADRPNRGVEGAPRKQVVPRKYREDGTVARRPGGDISPEDRSRWWPGRSHGPSVRSPTPSDPSASDARTLRSRKTEFVVLQKSTRGSILLLKSTSADVSGEPHRWFQHRC